MIANELEVSIVIPTYNRTDDLSECLDSLLLQTILPREVIIVDDSDDEGIHNLIDSRKIEFEGKGVDLVYIRNTRKKSSAIARNIGVERAMEDIIIFLDDDVILDRQYIEYILLNYSENDRCLGMQGYVKNKRPHNKLDRLKNVVDKLSFNSYFEKNSCRVLPSTNCTYPYPLEGVIPCEWLYGCNMSFRRWIFDIIEFDEELMRYAFKEDLSLSYLVHKKFPGSLYIEPRANLIHKGSPAGRLQNREMIRIWQIYDLYCFFRIIDQCRTNKLIFLWSKLAYLGQTCAGLILRPTYLPKIKILNIKYLLESYLLCIQNLDDIRKGDLEFFNKYLMSLTGFIWTMALIS